MFPKLRGSPDQLFNSCCNWYPYALRLWKSSSYVSFFFTSQHLHHVESYPIKLLLRKIKLNHGYLIFIVVEEIRNSGLSYEFSEVIVLHLDISYQYKKDSYAD